MTRLTEYHNGVAVIKNKDFKAAAEKLAKYEDMEKETESLMSEIEIDEDGYMKL